MRIAKRDSSRGPPRSEDSYVLPEGRVDCYLMLRWTADKASRGAQVWRSNWFSSRSLERAASINVEIVDGFGAKNGMMGEKHPAEADISPVGVGGPEQQQWNGPCPPVIEGACSLALKVEKRMARYPAGRHGSLAVLLSVNYQAD
ncbi:hypothetical protein VDGL01_10018 [Verticillium dahliae]